MVSSGARPILLSSYDIYAGQCALSHCESCKDYYGSKRIETLPWPAQSPDMNPIENLWAIVKKRRQKKYGFPKTKTELIDQIFDIWENIETKLVEKLADSANTRVNAVLKLKGKVSITIRKTRKLKDSVIAAIML